MSSARPVTRGRPGQGFTPLFPDRANRHVATGQHGPTLSEGGNSLSDNFTNGSGAIFAGLGGTITARRLVPFFHEPLIREAKQYDLA